MSDVLAGRRVMIVEDEYFIADDLRRTLNDAGAEVIGPTSDLKQAMLALESGKPDFALLDINLNGDAVYPLAKRLQTNGTPFAFLTGYSHSTIPQEFETASFLEKPCSADAVIRTVLESRGTNR